MNKAGATLFIAASLLATGCSTSPAKISIRPIGDQSEPRRLGNDQLAYGRAQLRLGNAGTALEAFRKAQRKQPNNAEALAGIADSYAAMGRQDVARHYYEAALAMAPDDPILLKAVASSDSETPQLSRAVPRQESSSTSTATMVPAAKQETSTTVATASVTMKLPPLTKAQAPKFITPHLERLSPGEVALVTTARPIWEAVVVSRTRLSTKIRWIPVRSAAAQPPIHLLNAARSQGLAARTRQALYDQGWRKLAIGDAPRVRTNSLVLYPVMHEAAARSIAARLGFHASSKASGDSIIVLLGRDAERLKGRHLRA
jgi:tetratricopeptide (TPR) repeat protein